jgi:RNA polymerase sigma-70 factor (ECF subfamily)
MSPSSQSDLAALVRRCLAGDEVALRELVCRFYGPVFGLCCRMLGHWQDAEDAVQETFLRLVRNLDRWDPQREMLPWVLAIAANRCRTMLAARKMPQAAEEAVLAVPDRAISRPPADELNEELQQALNKIRPQHREAFLLFHEHGLAYEQIAAALGVPLGTVKTWVHRARQELIAHLRQRECVTESAHALPRV